MSHESEPLPLQLPSDSPLVQPLAFARMTMDVDIQCALLELDGDEELRSQTSRVLRTLPTEYLQLRHRHFPCYSLMTDDEAAALLTLPGTVWFLAQTTGLPAERCAQICMLGQPWRVWTQRADLLLATPVFSLDQVVFLIKLFHKDKMPLAQFNAETQHLPLKNNPRLYEMLFGLYSKQWADEQPVENPPDTYWENVARKSGEHILAIRWVATALGIYLLCLVKYATQRGIEGHLREESKSDG